MPPRFAQVCVEGTGAFRSSVYTYRIPPAMMGRIVPGSFVVCPFGKRTITGYVIALTDVKPPFALKDIAHLQADEPLISADAIALAGWVAENWCAGLSECLRPFLPPGGRQVFTERVELRETDLSALTAAPRQLAVAEALAVLGEDVRIERVLRQVRQAGWPKASPDRLRETLRALEARGAVNVRQLLRAPTARPFSRKHVRLLDAAAADAVLAETSVTSPRQALVLQALLASPGGLPLRDLPRAAVTSLERKGLVETEDLVTERRVDEGLASSGEYLDLTPHQRHVVDAVAPAFPEHRYLAALLHGVTGSGKTEVYLHALRDCLAAGRNAIVLVPEIALTPQIVGRIAARFGSQVAVLHSALSPGQRYDEWQRLRLGRARIAVGPRSALFAPLDNLGLIVVDEEHEPAYKQSSSPRYHARPVAFELARRHNAVLLLGTATPSIETYHAAISEDPEFGLFELPERIDARPLPAVRIVDLREDVFVGAGRTFSEPLLAALEQTLDRGEQAILFLNRRGFATYIVCRGCGKALECPDCGVSLTYHHTTRTVQCHYCSYTRPMPKVCKDCGSEDLGFLGLGTQRVAEQLERQFPDVKLARLDRDSVRRQGTVRDVLAAFARGETQVLVGTQMVAKGLDFPGVTMVGVLNADVGLGWSDFRSAERTFQLITQVAGRAGRAEKPGLVVVQTYNPEHRAITAAAEHDYARFYAGEIESRRELNWPPFVHLARLVVTDADEAKCKAKADVLALALGNLGVRSEPGGVHYIGPAKAPLERLRGEWRYHLVVKSPDRAALVETIDKLVAVAEVKKIAPMVDIDPAEML